MPTKPAKRTTKRTPRKTATKRAPRKAAARKAGRQPGPLSPEAKASQGEKMTRTKTVSRYLQFLADGGTGDGAITITGVGDAKYKKTTDPVEIQEAIVRERAKLQEMPIGAKRLVALQKIRDMEAAFDRLVDSPNGASPEAAFVEVARAYSDENGIDYGTWRDAGVPARVLKLAGIER